MDAQDTLNTGKLYQPVAAEGEFIVYAAEVIPTNKSCCSWQRLIQLPCLLCACCIHSNSCMLHNISATVSVTYSVKQVSLLIQEYIGTCVSVLHCDMDTEPLCVCNTVCHKHSC